MRIKYPIQKILLPVDGSEYCKSAVVFAGCLGSLMGKRLAGISLIRVIRGSYLSRHINYVDFRAEVLKQSDVFKRIKNEHIEKNITPFLNDAEKTLKELGVQTDIEKIVIDGDPAEAIVSTAEKDNFTTIIMARRGLSERKEHSLGSVTNKVLHAAFGQTVYVVGNKVVKKRVSPITKILVPVDGSSYSLKGVEHASSLAEISKNSLAGITLLRVINISRYEKSIIKGRDPEKESKEILNNAKSILIQAEIKEDLLDQKVRIGIPADEILKEAEEGGYKLIIIGRKGRSTFRDYLIGSVSSKVLNRCYYTTVAIVGGN